MVIIERIIIDRKQSRFYRSHGYDICRSSLPGKAVAIFWVPANA